MEIGRDHSPNLAHVKGQEQLTATGSQGPKSRHYLAQSRNLGLGN